MNGIWWKLPVLRKLTMLRRGIVEAATTMIGLSVSLFIAIALAARVHSGHWLFIDRLGFGFVLGALLMAGVFVVMQPVIAHEWMDDPAGSSNGPDHQGPDVR